MIHLLAALWLAAPAPAQDLPRPELHAKMSAFNVTTRAFVYPSGLRVIMQADKSTPNVTLSTVYGGGQASDPKGKAGSAHLAEHLSFHAVVEPVGSRIPEAPLDESDGEGEEGAAAPEPVPPVTARDLLTANGARWDALTVAEWGTFSATATKPALADLIAVEGQRMSNPMNGLTAETVEVEKGLMALEPKYRAGMYYDFAWPEIWKGLFGTEDENFGMAARNGYRRAPTLTLEDAKAWAEEHYQPSNATMVILGDIDFDEVTALLFEHLPAEVIHPDATEEQRRRFLKPGIVNADPSNPDHVTYWMVDPETEDPLKLEDKEIVRASSDREDPGPPPDARREAVHVQGLVSQPVALVAWALPGSWSDQEGLLRISGNAVASAGWTDWSGLFEVAKDPTSGGPLAGCIPYGGLNAGVLVCHLVARDDRVDAEELADRIQAAASVFWNPQATGMHESTTQLGQRRTLAGMLRQLDHPEGTTQGGRASAAAINAHFYGKPTYSSELMNNVMGVERNEVPKWVQTWLNESRAIQIIVDPMPPEERLSIAPTAWYHATVFPTPIPDLKSPTNEEIAEAFSAPDLGKAVEKELANGLKVVVLPHGEAPVVVTTLASRGGSAYGQGIDDISDIAMRRLNDEIWEDTTGSKQTLLPEMIGAQWAFGRDTHVTLEGLTAPAGNLDGALYLLRRNADARKLKAGARSRWFRNVKLALPLVWENRTWWAQRERMQRVLPDHPTTWTLTQDEALRLKDMPPTEVVDWNNRKFSPENSTLFIVGDVDPDEAIEQATTYWAGWRGGAGSPLDPVPAPTDPAGKATLVLDAPGSEHAVISATCPLPTPTAKNMAANLVLRLTLDAHLGEVLKAEGVTAIASTVSLKNPPPVAWLDAVTVVPHDQADAALKALKKSLRAPQKDKLSDNRIQQSKLTLAGNHSISQVSSATTTTLVANAYMLQTRGKTWFDDYGKALAGVDQAALKAASADCMANLVVTVEAPMDSVKPHLKDWEAEVIDWVAMGDAELERWDKKAYKRKLKQRAKAGK